MSKSKKKPKKGNELITEDTTIGEILKKFPFTGKTMLSMGLDCVPCKGRERETLQQAAEIHGLDPKEVINKLREVISRKKSSMDA